MLSFFDYRQLDVSFNILRKVEGLEQLTRLKKLFLLHNKISSISNLDHFTCLEMLELGSNRIRVQLKGPLGEQPVLRTNNSIKLFSFLFNRS